VPLSIRLTAVSAWLCKLTPCLSVSKLLAVPG
jgi:hypothetical protein